VAKLYKWRRIATAVLNIGVPCGFGIFLWMTFHQANSHTSPDPVHSSPPKVATQATPATNVLPRLSVNPPWNLVAANGMPTPVTTRQPPWSNLAPGVYRAMPYSMIVVVPPDMDAGIACAAPDNSKFNMPLIDPGIHLEKISPH
jgi:hypothetical protein